jgi:hypothetical protein
MRDTQIALLRHYPTSANLVREAWAMPIAAVTRLRLRSLRFLPAHLFYAMRALRQARRSDGCLAADARNQGLRLFWTRTLWRDTKAMRAFMTGGPHRLVMPKLLDWCDEASLADWDRDTLPDWSDAEAQLRRAGRVSRVRNPSAAHARGETVPDI